MINIGRAFECICTRLCNGVHTTTDEIGLTNIVGRDNNLQLLDGINRNRVTTTRKVTAKSEVIVEIGTINSEVSSTWVTSCKCHSVTSIRRKAGNINDRTVYSRQIGYLRTVDVGGSTGLLCSKLRCLTADNNLRELCSILREPDSDIVGLSELKYDTLDSLWLITDV